MPAERDLRLAGAQHEVRDRPLRPLPARAGVHLQGRPGVPAGTRSSRCCGCGSSDGRASPKLAVWKFASCDGCQLSLLDCEDELLALAGEVEIAYFLEAVERDRSRARTTSRSSRARSPRPRTPSASSGCASSRGALVTIGACATAGGIQALRNFADVEDFLAAVYASPEYVSTLATSTADLRPRARRLRAAGLPDRQAPAARGDQRLPQRAPAGDLVRTASASSASARGNVCVMVAHGTPCLGPVTHAGCGALCPSYDRGCYGCFGPMETPEHGVARPAGSRGLGCDEVGPRARLPHVQRERRAVPRGERGA